MMNFLKKAYHRNVGICYHFFWVGWCALGRVSLKIQGRHGEDAAHTTIFSINVYNQPNDASLWIRKPDSVGYKYVISSRWMIHREEWVLNIFIQHHYRGLTDAYKKDKSLNPNQCYSAEKLTLWLIISVIGRLAMYIYEWCKDTK